MVGNFSLCRLMLQLPEDMGLIAVAGRQTKGKGQPLVHYTVPLRALWIPF